MEKVYLVVMEQGEYDEYEMMPAKCFKTKAGTEYFIEMANKEINHFQ